MTSAANRKAALISHDTKEPWRRRLTLPAYQVKDAARYAGVRHQTVLNWQRVGESTGSAIDARKARAALSYLQLQELAIVAAMRQQGIKLQTIRLARDYLSTAFKLEFPFADERVKADGQDILMEFKEELGGAARLLVANRGGQYVWQDVIGNKFREFEYERSLAIRWHVRGSRVVIDPRISFGAPSIRGVPTWALLGRYKAGESIEDLASDFVISTDQVKHALKFEGVTVQ